MRESVFSDAFSFGLPCRFFQTAMSVLLFGMALGLFFPRLGHAAPADSSCSAARAQQFARGLAALEDDAVQQATRYLQDVVEAEPGCYTDLHGAAAYWLGVAHQRAGRDDQQLEAWTQGVEVLSGPEMPFDVRLANAYVHRVFTDQNGTHYGRAARTYLHLLEQIGQPMSPGEVDILTQQLRLTAAVLPPAVRSRTGLSGKVKKSIVATLPEKTGQRLVTWWRGQDPLPATHANERLEEHLERVAHVRNHFQTEGRIDDRGLVFVRLGPPSRETTIQFNSIRFNQSVLSFDSRFSMSDFKSGRFWVYDHIDRATQYLFIEADRDVFEIGNVRSMLPSELRRGFSSSHRGYEEAAAFVRAMEEAYSQLAVYHDRYHSLHQELSNYTIDLDVGATGSVTRRNRTVLDFARRTLLNVKQADTFHRKQRETQTPLVYSNKPSDVSTIPIAVRYARFLRPDGATRVEVFWSAPYSGLVPVSRSTTLNRYLLTTSLVKRGDDGRPLTTRHQSNTVRVKRVDDDAFLSPQVHNLRAKPEQSFRLDLQWNQFETATLTNPPMPGEMVGRYVHQSDTLHALDPDQSDLVLSDPRVMVMPTDASPAAVEEAIPYPFSQVNPDMTLVLYFEVYHLAFTGDDQTRYSVEYEVRRQAKDGRLVQLFAGDDTQSTAAEATCEGNSRTAKEYIMLDLSEWDEDDDLTVTVQVTDEATGQQVERSADFEAAN